MAENDDADHDEPAITKRTLVRETLEMVRPEPCVVRADEDLLTATERLEALQGVHTVAVVDDEGRLVGIIPMRLLLDELYLEVAPEEFLVELKEMEDVEVFGRISRATKAEELMEEPVCVTMDDTVREAFARMHERRLEGLPIVDEEMKVVGYLDRLQLLRLWVKRYGRGRE